MPDSPCTLQPGQFVNLLLTQLPVYAAQILADVRPTDGLLGHINTGQADAFSGPVKYKDRFRNVKANVSAKWQDVGDIDNPAAPYADCADGPCDPIANEICWGWERTKFAGKKQSWQSKMLCFDQIIQATQAPAHIGQIVSDVLKPATSDIASFFIRKEALRLAGNKLLANATMSSFTLTWDTTGNQEIYATVNALPTSKLTPEMLQRQLPRMRGLGYFGKWTNDPFWGGYNELAELITDDETAWDMDRVALNQNLANAFRFTQWTAAHEYYKYGMGGQIGNFMVHIDPFCLRFNKVNATKLQLVLPYRNDPTTAGLGSDWNADYDNAQHQISFIWHRFAWKLNVQQMQSANPTMPFVVRGLDGQWHFATNDLGADCNGKPIANFRGNKGFYWADFQYESEPMYVEWLTAILHLREPKVLYIVAPCAADPGYPSQNYNSACDGCSDTFSWVPDPDGEGHYVLAANSVTCGSNPVENGAIDAASLAALVIALNADTELGALGTFSEDGTNLILTGSSCVPDLPWVV